MLTHCLTKVLTDANVLTTVLTVNTMIIPLREFQLHASTYLPIKEEIELTRYGKTVARIIPPSGQVPVPSVVPSVNRIIKTPEDALEAVHLTELPFSKHRQAENKL